MSKGAAVAAIAAAFLAAAAAWAADKAANPSPVEQAVQAHETLPMEDIIRRAKAEQPGQVQEIELEHKHGRLLYEVNLVADDGSKKELKFDAKTGELVSKKDDDEDDDDD
ncbi:MAG TPA: PepSY domain-containing protein [Burkholderiales bacterium]|nr:PepSY domain-containing protein [Burkholderiales bacterium]